ncbi:uncharacterized protein PV06_01157 [Exophiala oligosperma]|uniref:Uncharacterized protein n=1 Tax=Exophiala oligosperma TaxID=215243 RepID=A0A0D2E1E5_9EURO|nr:uncharacterized protein PV06_01157 [Exophiala oligosperma]KIW48585.1 hypothetical protein PV06_01157 [Exophiala oligosperma]
MSPLALYNSSRLFPLGTVFGPCYVRQEIMIFAHCQPHRCFFDSSFLYFRPLSSSPCSKASISSLSRASSLKLTLPVHHSSRLSALDPSQACKSPTLTSISSGLSLQCQNTVAPHTPQNSRKQSLELSICFREPIS